MRTTLEPQCRRQRERVSSGIPAVGIAVLLLGFALRLNGLGGQSIWYDEGSSIVVAQRSLRDIWSTVQADHVPLYFWLLHLWLRLVGSSEFAARYLSLLAGVLAIPLSYQVTRLLGNRNIALLTAFVSAISPFYVYYSQEARMYTLMVVLTLLAVYSFCRLTRDRGPRSWLLYVLSTTGLAYTHYYGLLVPVFLNAAFSVNYLLRRRTRLDARTTRQGIGSWVSAQMLFLLLYSPWAWQKIHLYDDFVSASREALTATAMFWKAVIAFGLGHSVEKLNASGSDAGYAQDHQLALVLSSVLLAIIALGVLSNLRWWPTSTAAFPRMMIHLTLLWLIVPAAMFYVLAAGKRDFAARYLIAAAPAYYILLAEGVLALRRFGRPLLLVGSAAVLAISAYALWNYYADPRYARDDQRGAAAYVQQHAVPNEAIILNANYLYRAFTYYYRGGAPWYWLPEDHPLDAAKTAAKLSALGGRYDYLWLVLWQDYYSDPERFVETYLDGNYIRTREQTFHGNIKIRGYRTRSPLLQAEPAGTQRVGLRLGDEVELVGYRLADGPTQAGEELGVTLYWRALRAPSADYTVFVHLVNSAGQVIAQGDGPPVFGRLPTNAWPIGATIEDEHRLAVPAYTPPGDYALTVGLYDRGTMLRLGERGIDRAHLAPVRLARGEVAGTAIPHLLSIDLGDSVRLAGFDLDEQAKLGGALRIDLFWQARAPIVDDLTVFVHLLDQNGVRRAQDDGKPARGSYPSKAWVTGEIVRDQHSLSIPADAPPGNYSIAVGLYDAQSGQRLSYRSWPWARPETSVILRQVVVRP